jgi:aminopeptidase N
MKRLMILAMLAVWILAACGGGGDSVTIQIDPDALLLRSDLPAPAQQPLILQGKQALRVAARAPHRGAESGDAIWLPDLMPNRIGRLPETFPKVLPAPPNPPPKAEKVEIALTIDPKARTLTGQATIELKAESDTLTVATFSLSAAAVDSVQAVNPTATFTYQDGVLAVTAATPVPAGSTWTVTIAWHDADVEQQIDFTPEGGGVLLGNYLGEPSTFFTWGYDYWPKLVGQGFFGTLDFSVTFPKGLTLVLSGTRIDQVDNGDQTVTERWTLDKPNFGAIGLALAAYEKATAQCGTTAVEVYAIPGMSIDQFPIRPATYAPLIQAMCGKDSGDFGAPAFATLRVVGVDERFTNGYATPGLVMAPNYTFDDDGTGSFPERDFFLAHEIAHQWFGVDVLLTDLRDAWLTEGLADFAAAGYLVEPWGEAEALRAWLKDAAVLLDFYRQGGKDHPLVPDQAVEFEPRVYYLKGAWVLRMLASVIGEAPLNRALESYRAAHTFAPAHTEDFLAAATTEAGRDLAWFFDEWLKGTGVMALDFTQENAQDQVQVGVNQKTTWAAGKYFQMPLTVRVGKDERTLDQNVELDGAATSNFLLTIP